MRRNVEQGLVSDLRDQLRHVLREVLLEVLGDGRLLAHSRLRDGASETFGISNLAPPQEVVLPGTSAYRKVAFQNSYGSAEPLPPFQTTCGKVAFEESSAAVVKDGGKVEFEQPSSSLSTPTSERKSTASSPSRASHFLASSRKSCVGPAHKSWTEADSGEKIRRFVKSDVFDYVMSIILVLNSVVIGARVDYEASNLGERSLVLYVWFDRLFCVAFVTELLLRIYTFNLQFYLVEGWQWAYFDTVIVVIMVFEETLIIVKGVNAMNIGFLKLLKLGRLLRMVRMVRLLPELRSLVILIMGSISSFVWTCVLLLLLVYALAIYMVMMATDSMEKTIADSSTNRAELQRYWGSVGSAVLSLYCSITGGRDWADVIGPLVAETGNHMHNVVFSMFIAFATMVLMNLVTGVFVEGAQRLSKEDSNRELSRMATKTFRAVDSDFQREISMKAFINHLDEGHMDTYLKAVDLTRSSAASLFDFLDTDHGGSISVEEFVDGCLRLRGLPRSADVSLVLLEARKQAALHQDWFAEVSSLVQKCRQEVKLAVHLTNKQAHLHPDNMPESASRCRGIEAATFVRGFEQTDLDGVKKLATDSDSGTEV